jgi:hypothetical protein
MKPREHRETGDQDLFRSRLSKAALISPPKPSSDVPWPKAREQLSDRRWGEHPPLHVQNACMARVNLNVILSRKTTFNIYLCRTNPNAAFDIFGRSDALVTGYRDAHVRHGAPDTDARATSGGAFQIWPSSVPKPLGGPRRSREFRSGNLGAQGVRRTLPRVYSRRRSCGGITWDARHEPMKVGPLSCCRSELSTIRPTVASRVPAAKRAPERICHRGN